MTTIDGVTYTTSGTTATASSYDGSVTNITMPSTITIGVDSFTVTSIGLEAFINSEIQQITIPNSVTSIGANAFLNSINLTSLTIQGGVNTVTIDSQAFSGTGITTMTIPNSVTSIGVNAFSITNLNTVIIEDGDNILTITPGAFSGSGLETITIANSVTTIGANLSNCFNLKNIIILGGPNLVTIFNSLTRSALRTVVIPNSVTTIRNDTFNTATNLDSVIITGGTNPVTIGDRAFFATALTTITIPNSVTSIGANAFSITNLNTVIIEEGTGSVSIGIGAFRDTAITTITIPSSVISIGLRAFLFCNNLSSVYFKSGCTLQNTSFSTTSATVYAYNGNIFTIGTVSQPFSPTVNPLSTFFSTWRLYDYPYPDTNTTYSSGNAGPFVLYSNSFTFSFYTYSTVVTNYTILFYDSNSDPITGNTPTLSYSNYLVTFTVSVPSNVARLTLNGNDMMVVFQIVVDGVTYTISGSTASATSYSGSVYNIVIPSTIIIGVDSFTVTSIAPNAFSGSIFGYITIPNSVTSIETSAFEGGDFSFVIIEDGENTVTINEKAFYNSRITSIFIPNSVTSIGNQAFELCENLISVAIQPGNNNLTIGENAFSNTGLTNINIPNTVTFISDFAFSNCISLTSVIIEDGPNTITIGNSVFTSSGLTSIIVPNSVTSIGNQAFFGTPITSVAIRRGNNNLTIGENAFSNTSLTKINIPNRVISIGTHAFGTSALISLTIEDGLNNVTIGVDAFSGTGLTSIRIPNSVTFIRDSAFANCISLTSVIIEDGVKPVTIADAAFKNCQIVSIIIPQSVISIGVEAFFQPTLESVTIDGVTTLDGSFSDVKNLCVKDDNNLYVSSFPNLELLVYNQEYSNGFGIPQSVPFYPNASVELSGTSLIIDKVFDELLVLQGKYNTDIISNNFFSQVTFPLTIDTSKSYLFDFTISYGTLSILNVPIRIIQDSPILSIVTDILPDTSTWTNYNLFVFEQLVNTLPKLVSIPKLPDSAFIEVSPHYSSITTIYAVPYQSTLDISQYVFGTTILLLLSTYPNPINIGVELYSDGTRSYVSTILFLLGTSITLGNYKIRLVANSSSNITIENVESPVVPVSTICFPAGTPVLTDQGYIPIDKITRHTLNKKPIQLIKTTHVENFLICFEKDSLERNMPFQRTLISKDHIVYYKEFSGKAIDFIPHFYGVFKVTWGEILYNVLVDVHTKITVNNMICETLNPKKQNPNKIVNYKKEHAVKPMGFR